MCEKCIPDFSMAWWSGASLRIKYYTGRSIDNQRDGERKKRKKTEREGERKSECLYGMENVNGEKVCWYEGEVRDHSNLRGSQTHERVGKILQLFICPYAQFWSPPKGLSNKITNDRPCMRVGHKFTIALSLDFSRF